MPEKTPSTPSFESDPLAQAILREGLAIQDRFSAAPVYELLLVAKAVVCEIKKCAWRSLRMTWASWKKFYPFGNGEIFSGNALVSLRSGNADGTLAHDRWSLSQSPWKISHAGGNSTHRRWIIAHASWSIAHPRWSIAHVCLHSPRMLEHCSRMLEHCSRTLEHCSRGLEGGRGDLTPTPPITGNHPFRRRRRSASAPMLPRIAAPGSGIA